MEREHKESSLDEGGRSRPAVLAEVEALLGLSSGGPRSSREAQSEAAGSRISETLNLASNISSVASPAVSVEPSAPDKKRTSVPAPPCENLKLFSDGNLVYRVRCLRQPEHRVLVSYQVEQQPFSAVFTARPHASSSRRPADAIGRDPDGTISKWQIEREPDTVAGSWLPHGRRRWGAEWWGKATMGGSAPAPVADLDDAPSAPKSVVPSLPRALEEAASKLIAKSIRAQTPAETDAAASARDE